MATRCHFSTATQDTICNISPSLIAQEATLTQPLPPFIDIARHNAFLLPRIIIQQYIRMRSVEGVGAVGRINSVNLAQSMSLPSHPLPF
tara:strand:- start:1111 stop:1377 length:267 start_codon:yes stop_codon:yes gene_type:complete